MREFVTAAQQRPASAIEGAEPATFALDGEEFTAYPPTPGQMALVIAAQESSDLGTRVAGVIDFMDCVLDTAGRERFRERLFDRDDPFDLVDVETVLEGLLEDWTAVPTPPRAVSSGSRARTGSSSTARRRSAARTSSTSRSAAS